MKIIAAISLNNVMGKNNSLPWTNHWPNDLKRFKELTLNSTIIMGRKTFESIGRPLPKRQNIVVSKSAKQLKDVEYVTSIQDGLKLAKNNEICIIGGSSIYKEAMEIAKNGDMLDLTIIPETITGDNLVHFPDINDSWILNNKEVCEDGRVILTYIKTNVLS